MAIAHRYWRIKSNIPNGTQDIAALKDLAFAELGKPEHATVTPIRSNDDGGSGIVAHAYDEDYNSRWEAGTTGVSWIGMDFGQPKIVQTVRLKQHAGERTIKGFDVEWSDNGTDWTLAWSRGDFGYNSRLPFYSFPDPAEAHSLVRILDTQVGSSGSAIGEIELRHAVGGPDQIPTAVTWPCWGNMYQFGALEYQLHDDNASTQPFMNANGWVVIEPPGGWSSCAQLALTRNSGGDARMMTAFKVQTTSDAGATWDDQLEVTGLAAWASGETRVFTLPNGLTDPYSRHNCSSTRLFRAGELIHRRRH